MLDETCEATHKVCFASHTTAERTMAFIKRNGDRKNSGSLRRAYRCPDCRFWHVTSWSNEEEWK